jgi:hypothetical protein
LRPGMRVALNLKPDAPASGALMVRTGAADA